MAIRVDCDLEGHKDLWVEFREDRWTFGDRRKVSESFSDSLALTIILGYVEAWHLLDVNGKEVEFVKELEGLDDMDDRVVVWIVRAWFQARNKRAEVPKVS
jgi:hypothetical protein